PVQTINDNTLAYGTKAVRQAGTDGQQIVTYQIAITNNVETGRTVLQKVVTKAPVTQVQVVGTSLSGIKGDMALAGIAPGDYNYVDYIVSHESGWRPNATNSSGSWGLCQATPGSKMASAGADVGPEDTVLEVGPGLGSLTVLLAARAKRVIAVELDQRLAAELPKRVPAANLTIIPQDILSLDFGSLPPDYKIAANIPYYL